MTRIRETFEGGLYRERLSTWADVDSTRGTDARNPIWQTYDDAELDALASEWRNGEHATTGVYAHGIQGALPRRALDQVNDRSTGDRASGSVDAMSEERNP